MNTGAAAFSGWMLSYRKPIILAGLLITLIAANGLAQLSFSTDYKLYFDADNPQLQHYEALQRTYTEYDSVLFVIEPASGNVFTRETLQAVDRITEAGWQLPWSGRVDSLANYQHIRAQGDELIIAPFYEDPATLTDAELKSIREQVLAETDLRQRLISTEGHVTAVNVVFHLPDQDAIAEVATVNEAVQALAAEIERQFPGIDIRLSGMLMMNHAFLESEIRDLSTLIPIALLVVVGTLFLLLYNTAGTLSTIAVVFLTTVTTMGITGLLGFVLTPTTAIIPILLLTLVVANSVHIICGYQDNLCQGAEHENAIRDSLQLNLQPMFITGLTTLLGFLSLNAVDTPPMRDMGNIAAIGMAVTFLFTVTLLPALIAQFPGNIQRQRTHCNLFMEKLGRTVVQRRKSLLLLTAVLASTLILAAPGNKLNDEYLKFFDESITFRADTEFMTRNLTGIYQIQYSIKAMEDGGIQEPEFLRLLDDFVTWFRGQPEVMNVSAITDIMKQLNQTLHGDDANWYRLPASRQEAAQFLLIYESSLPVGLDINDRIDVAKSATRVSVTLRNLDSQSLLALEERARQWLAANTPGHMHAPGSSPAIMFANISETNIPAMLTGVAVALLLISLLIMQQLRSVAVGLISLVPNMVPVLMAFGVWALVVGEVGMTVAVVASMTIGIIVDDSVHFLSKYLHARRHLGYDTQKAVCHALSTVGTALMVTSVVLMAGFLVLALSPFNANAHMGILCALTIGFALLADLLLLPPLLIMLEGRKYVAIGKPITSTCS